MRVGRLIDTPSYIGGAELTAQGFLDAAPEGVEVVDCLPGGVEDCDRYLLHNITGYSVRDIEATSGRPLVKYMHDVWPHGNPDVREHVLSSATLIFLSPLQRQRMGWGDAGYLIPPALDLDRLRSAASAEREGTCWLGRMYHGKGIHLAEEWAEENESVDFYGEGPQAPASSFGPVPYEQVPDVLGRYQRFLYLPTALEPFGRTVAEAWASGCEIVTNRNVGALYWIREDPDALEAAGEFFWRVVLDG